MHKPLYLQNDQGESLQLWIDSYEFPEIENEVYDSNWLNVAIEVNLAQGSWTKIHPCLETTELEYLIRWFTAVGKNQNTRVTPGLIEPNLFFKLTGQFPCNLQIHFSHEFKPDWVEWEDELYLEFSLDQTTLLEMIEAFEGMLEDFPTRHRK